MDPDTETLLTLPDLRVTSHAFFDYDFTYLALFYHVFFYYATNGLIRNLMAPANSDIDPTRGISGKTLIFYTLAFSARIAGFYPFSDYFSFDFLVCCMYAVAFWISTISWVIFCKEPITATDNDKSRLWVNGTIIVTGLLAHYYNYNELEPTFPVFFWAWSQYLEGVAMIPQLWDVASFNNKGDTVSKEIWFSIHMNALSRMFQIGHWIYLYYDVDMMDQLQVIFAAFYLLAYVVFISEIVVQDLKIKRTIKHEEQEAVLKTD